MSKNKTIIQNLSYSYQLKHNNMRILDNISLQVQENEIVSLLGPSGCGKTTLLKCTSGLLKNYTGSISINGKSVSEAKKSKEIGYAFQDSGLLFWKNLRENIMMPNQVGIRKIPRKEADERVKTLLSLIELQKFEDFYPSQMSGGMKQRANLARALFSNPKLLLLDEPFSGTDLPTRLKLMIEFNKVIREFKIPTIFVTHSPEEAIFMSNQIYILTNSPATIKHTISVDKDCEKDKSYFVSDTFQSQVTECKKKIMN